MSVGIVLLVDESAAMDAAAIAGGAGSGGVGAVASGGSPKSKAESVATAINSVLAKLAQAGDCEIALVGYRSSKEGESQVAVRWSGPLAGREFVAAAEIAAAPTTVETRMRKVRNDLGGFDESPVSFPIWYQPTLGDKAPQIAAFECVRDLLTRWAPANGVQGQPLIVHITSGTAGDGNPLRAIKGVQDLAVGGATPIVAHLHLSSSANTPSVLFPANRAYLSLGPQRELFERSSLLPGHLCEALKAVGVVVHVNARAMIYNAKMMDVTKALGMIAAHVQKSLAGQAVAAASPVARPRPPEGGPKLGPAIIKAPPPAPGRAAKPVPAPTVKPPSAVAPPPAPKYLKPAASAPVASPAPPRTQTPPAVTATPVSPPTIANPATKPAAALEPLAVEPLAVEPLMVEPLMVEPLVVEPLAVEPLSVEPLAPLEVEPMAAGTMAAGPMELEPIGAAGDDLRLASDATVVTTAELTGTIPASAAAAPPRANATISPTSPGCLLFVLDRSVADPFTADLGNACSKLHSLLGDMVAEVAKHGKGAVDVAVVSYGDSAGDTEVRTTLEGGLSGRVFARDSELLAGAVRIDEFEEQMSDGVGGLIAVPRKRPVLVEVEPTLSTGSRPAFRAVAEALRGWINDHPSATLNPVVVHLTRGAGDPADIAAGVGELTGIATASGAAAVVYHLVATESPHPSVVFPASAEALATDSLKALWNSAAELLFNAELAAEKPAIKSGARGLVVNGKFFVLMDPFKRAMGSH
ncbi:MAG: hypothetical protein ACKO38_13325 [Planctomycetota bacterium]